MTTQRKGAKVMPLFRKIAEGSGYARRMLGPAWGAEKRWLGREVVVRVVVYVHQSYTLAPIPPRRAKGAK